MRQGTTERNYRQGTTCTIGSTENVEVKYWEEVVGVRKFAWT